MTWGKLYTEIKDADNVDFDTGTITANTFTQIMFYQVGHTGNSGFFYNGDGASSNYAGRISALGGTDSTVTSQNKILNQMTGGTADTASLAITNVINISGEEKLSITHTIYTSATGAGTAPRRTEYVSKWANTSAQITQIEVDDSGTGFDTGSAIAVLGSEGQTAVPAKIQDGLIFEETDTNKHYIYTASTDTWTEI